MMRDACLAALCFFMAGFSACLLIFVPPPEPRCWGNVRIENSAERTTISVRAISGPVDYDKLAPDEIIVLPGAFIHMDLR